MENGDAVIQLATILLGEVKVLFEILCRALFPGFLFLNNILGWWRLHLHLFMAANCEQA